jgi:hypothetical protein
MLHKFDPFSWLKVFERISLYLYLHSLTVHIATAIKNAMKNTDNPQATTQSEAGISKHETNCCK